MFLCTMRLVYICVLSSKHVHALLDIKEDCTVFDMDCWRCLGSRLAQKGDEDYISSTWRKGRHHERHACDKERNQWINKYENMKLKE